MTYLITGGSGTFGHAFIRHILKQPNTRVVSMSRNSEMRYALEQLYRGDDRVIVAPGCVRQPADIEAVFQESGNVDVLIHAAAEKHIGTGERFRPYTYDNNVNGARNIIAAAQAHGVGKLVALSTDKACEPKNYYGETKRAAEQLFVNAGYCVVRYGNVTGSSGSVLPLFIKQRETGRITVTHREMTRFFMPVSYDSNWTVLQEPGRVPVMSAVELVQYAIDYGRGGEIFVPSIPSGSIVDVASQIGPECTIEETGIRPGEKLHEKLIADEEIPHTYQLSDGVFVVMSRPVPRDFSHSSDVNPQRLVIQ